MFRKIFFFIFLSIAVPRLTTAQLYGGYFYVNWNTYVPFTNKDFVGKNSSAGASLGYSVFVGNRWTVGIEIGNHTLKDYIPRKTYSLPGGNITTDIYNYHYYTTVAAKGQFLFKTEGKFLPFAGVGTGVVFNEYTQYYNVYTDAETETGFLVRPEAGIIFRPKDYAGWGIKASVVGDFAFVDSPVFELDNFYAIGFQLGFLLFND
jgi:hypothetical protein